MKSLLHWTCWQDRRLSVHWVNSKELGANLDLIFQGFDERRASHGLSFDNLVIKQRLNVVQGGEDGDIAFPVALVMEFNVIPRFHHGPHRLLQGKLLQTETSVC